MKAKTFTIHLELITNPYVHLVPKYVISTASMDMASVYATFWRTPQHHSGDVHMWPSPVNKCVPRQSLFMKNESRYSLINAFQTNHRKKLTLIWEKRCFKKMFYHGQLNNTIFVLKCSDLKQFLFIPSWWFVLLNWFFFFNHCICSY